METYSGSSFWDELHPVSLIKSSDHIQLATLPILDLLMIVTLPFERWAAIEAARLGFSATISTTGGLMTPMQDKTSPLELPQILHHVHMASTNLIRLALEHSPSSFTQPTWLFYCWPGKFTKVEISCQNQKMRNKSRKCAISMKQFSYLLLPPVDANGYKQHTNPAALQEVPSCLVTLDHHTNRDHFPSKYF